MLYTIFAITVFAIVWATMVVAAWYAVERGQ